MKICMYLLSIATTLSIAANDQIPGPKAFTRSLANSGQKLTLAIHAELQEKGKNTLFSPFSIATAMSMVTSGARGNTQKELSDALELSIPADKIPSAYKVYLDYLNALGADGGIRLQSAQALVSTGHGGLSDEFNKLLGQSFDAELFDGGLEEINAWVSEKTEGKIPKLLDQLPPNDVAVILNAIYFKGDWAQPFNKKHTRDTDFYVSAEDTVSVPLMTQKAIVPFVQEKSFQAVALPYAGNKVDMVILLPNDKTGLSALEKDLTHKKLQAVFLSLQQNQKKVRIFIPRFKMTSSCSLVKPFNQLGVNDAFDMQTANFEGMGWEKGSLKIGAIEHKAFIEVNEEGTEAAAATGVAMVTRSAAIRPDVFRADHPFLFFIRDKTSGTVLFAGRLLSPQSQE